MRYLLCNLCQSDRNNTYQLSNKVPGLSLNSSSIAAIVDSENSELYTSDMDTIDVQNTYSGIVHISRNDQERGGGLHIITFEHGLIHNSLAKDEEYFRFKYI